MHVHVIWHDTNSCHVPMHVTNAWYQCTSTIATYVYVWHGTNACHTMAYLVYQCMSHAL